MKEPHAVSSNHHPFRRDLAILVGIGALALVVGVFTPVFEYALAWLARLGLLPLAAGVLGSVTIAAVVLLVRRQAPRPLEAADAPAPALPEPVVSRPLTSFPDQNPHPVLEVSPQGVIHYANPPARRLFPTVAQEGAAHPILQDLAGLVAALSHDETPRLVREVAVGETLYEQQTTQVPGSDRLRFYLHDVTPRKLAREALFKSEEKFEHAFRSGPMAMSITRLGDGRFVDVNDHFLRLLGYDDREAIIGQTALELDMWATPGNRARVLDLLSRDDRVAHRYEAEVYTAQSELRAVIVSIVAMEVDGEACVLSALLDVTEHREAEAGLEMLKAFYENTLQALPIEVAVLDDEARFIYLNPTAMPDEEMRLWMVGKTSVEFAEAREFDPTPYQKRHAWLLDVIERKQIGRLEETLTTYTGEQRHLLRVAKPVLDDDDAVIYIVGYGIDMTERKAFERQLMQAKSAAEEMARLKSSFVANMSHEVRTPLTAILGFATVLGEELEGEQRELAEIIKQSGERLLETLNSVLDLARLEADALKIDPRTLNLGDELTAVVRLFGPMAEKKGLRLVLDAPGGTVRAPLDRAYLHRVLSNLLSNAIKFTEEGEVRLILKHQGNEVQIQVRDTGIGIDESFQPYLFEEFKQESTGLSRTHTGSGLGLAITRHLVEQMQGRIEVESVKGVGSTFTVVFPTMHTVQTTPGLYEQLDLFTDKEAVES